MRSKHGASLKRYGRWLLAAALVCAVAALYVVARRAQPPRLLDRATRVSPWDLMREEALPLPGPALLRIHTDNDLEHTRTFRLDTDTGVETPLPALDALLAKHQGDNWQVSPDGRTLLFRNLDLGDGGIAYGLCGLDGTGLTLIPRPAIGGDMLWLPDGRGWACLDWDRHAPLVVNRLGSPREQHLPLSGTPEAIERVAERETMLGFRADGHALVWTFAPRYVGDAGSPEACSELVDFAVAPGAAIHLTPVPLPQGATLGGLLLSPRGDRLACLTHRETPSRWPPPPAPPATPGRQNAPFPHRGAVGERPEWSKPASGGRADDAGRHGRVEADPMDRGRADADVRTPRGLVRGPGGLMPPSPGVAYSK